MSLRRNKFGVGDRVTLRKNNQECHILTVLYLESDDKYQYRLKEESGWFGDSDLDLVLTHQQIVFSSLSRTASCSGVANV